MTLDPTAVGSSFPVSPPQTAAPGRKLGGFLSA
jgi:hypothetical protein